MAGNNKGRRLQNKKTGVKLLNKLTLSITLSKLGIVLLFIIILPFIVERVASEYTNYHLRNQKEAVMKSIAWNGVNYYLEGDDSYGSYTMLKEEYISLEASPDIRLDTIETTRRLVERDTLVYRVLSYTFQEKGKTYLLEVGKKLTSINEYNRPLQRIALYVLIGLIILSSIIDLLYTRYLLRPLQLIIKSKLLKQSFPFKETAKPVQTTTADFKYLDSSLISLMDQIREAFEKEREFTANASHELMTPISILKSKIENMIIQEDASEDNLQRLTELMTTVSRLSRIVNSLLMISRIENDQYLMKEEVDVKELVLEVVTELEDRIQGSEIQIDLSLKESFIFQPSNKDLLFQLIYNLLNNAIKYNVPKGSIRITDRYSPEHRYELMISDTGIGISSADIPLIFNRFKKVHVQRSSGGYGLGLAISKTIADYHHIEIGVESEPDKGTTFTLLFPVSKA
ncbi:signal transduction histidine kinase [Arcticibacter pallidicorallinus]|uniref:histidine kinase n=1 Tax=Arcticibacter pallidicorallinus TaxID=1259464 RepID=A0A2T0TSE7_9SPHI|nr:HAMP domain-containing sensor histidine kinase [Arcticibacter pallidicorallinus]PRY48581.1 signal transduction histidine kinase [Arcticibacter pallidicorallinus]